MDQRSPRDGGGALSDEDQLALAIQTSLQAGARGRGERIRTVYIFHHRTADSVMTEKLFSSGICEM